MNKEKILFEIIISNQCNKRCSYCDLDFKDNEITYEVLDTFIVFLYNEINNVEYFTINFFGGEPLLGFKKIKYFIDKTTRIKDKLNFSIGTNGILLDNTKIDFFNKNNFDIYLSIDTESGNTILDKKIDLEFIFENVYINFIISPLDLSNLEYVFNKIINYGFININIMPAFGIKGWTEEKLQILDYFMNTYLNKYLQNNINKYSYYNGVGIDKQFILDTNGNIYQDLDSLLWIQKQNKNIGSKLSNYIENHTLIGNIQDGISLKNILNKYNIKNILNMMYLIPKKQGLDNIYKKIHLIIKK